MDFRLLIQLLICCAAVIIANRVKKIGEFHAVKMVVLPIGIPVLAVLLDAIFSFVSSNLILGMFGQNDSVLMIGITVMSFFEYVGVSVMSFFAIYLVFRMNCKAKLDKWVWGLFVVAVVIAMVASFISSSFTWQFTMQMDAVMDYGNGIFNVLNNFMRMENVFKTLSRASRLSAYVAAVGCVLAELNYVDLSIFKEGNATGNEESE